MLAAPELRRLGLGLLRHPPARPRPLLASARPLAALLAQVPSLCRLRYPLLPPPPEGTTLQPVEETHQPGEETRRPDSKSPRKGNLEKGNRTRRVTKLSIWPILITPTKKWQGR